jgi:cytochrome c peroxidase
MLDEKVKGMILEALNDEYKARAFKPPTLRSITESAPYMREGTLVTLEGSWIFSIMVVDRT